MSEPQYGIEGTVVVNTGGGNVSCEYVVISSSSHVSLGTTSGSHIGYDRVAVSSSKGGRKVHHFRSAIDQGAGSGLASLRYSFTPKPVGLDTDYRRGKPDTVNVIDSNGHVMQRKMTDYYRSSSTPSLRVRSMTTKSIASGVGFYFMRKEYTPERILVDSTRTVTYDEASGDSLSNVETRTYTPDSAPVPGQLRSKTVTSAQGYSRTTTYRYAYEEEALMGPAGMHQLIPVYRTTRCKGDVPCNRPDAGSHLRRSWTVWEISPTGFNLWVPNAEWAWRSE